jgi:hypothetical protein
MTVLAVTPKNKRELLMVEKFLEAFNVKFEPIEMDEKLYSPEFVAEILNTKNEKSTVINPKKLWESIQ